MKRLTTDEFRELKDGYIAMRENKAEGLSKRHGKSKPSGKLIFNDRRTYSGKSGGLWVWSGMVVNAALSSGLYNEIKGRLFSESEIRKIFTRDNIREFYHVGKRPEDAFWDVLRKQKNDVL